MATHNTCAECFTRHLFHKVKYKCIPDFNQNSGSVIIDCKSNMAENKFYNGRVPYSGKIKKSVDGWLINKNICYPYDVKVFEDSTKEGEGVAFTDNEINKYIRAHTNVLIFIFDRDDIISRGKGENEQKIINCSGFLSNCQYFTEVFPRYVTTIHQIRNAPFADRVMDGGGNYGPGRYFIEAKTLRGTCVVYRKNDSDNNYQNMLHYNGWKLGSISLYDVIDQFAEKDPWRRT